jgi:hypothetical protein
MSPFEIVYGQNPSVVLDIAPIPRVGRLNPKANELAEHLRGIHEQVKLAIQKAMTSTRLGWMVIAVRYFLMLVILFGQS